MADKSGVSERVLSLPRGGGAARGIGEKFQPDLHTGTGNFSIPLEVPPGRNGAQPMLQLQYSTGTGNGPFGLGWQLGVPRIARKTSRGVPRYRDRASDPGDLDTFVLSGAEDLVLIRSDTRAGPAGAETLRTYRPRTEGDFARIRRVLGAGADRWEVITRSGTRSVYGSSSFARIASASEPERIFAWLLERSETLWATSSTTPTKSTATAIRRT